MTDPDPTRLTILALDATTATVQLPSGTTEIWSLASLPRDVQPGDTVAVQVVDGELECWIEQARGISA